MVYGKYRRYKRKYRKLLRRTTRRTRVSRLFNRRKWKRRNNRPTTQRIRQLITTDQTFVKLKFRKQITLSTSGAPYYAYYAFRGNSPWDPDYTSSSPLDSQPTGFDQYLAFYKSFVCYGSKISCGYRSKRSNDGQNIYLTPSVDASPSFVGSTTVDAAEQPYTKFRVVGGYSEQPPTHQMKLKNYMSTKKMFNVSGELDTAYYAGTSANPTFVWNWIIYTNVFKFMEQSYSSVQVGMDLDVVITYYVKFYDRRYLTES